MRRVVHLALSAVLPMMRAARSSGVCGVVALVAAAACSSPPHPVPAPATTAPRRVEVVDAQPTALASTPSSSTSATVAPAGEPPLDPPPHVGPEVALHEVPLKIQQPPGTKMGHEWKKGRGVDWITFEKGAHAGENLYVVDARGEAEKEVSEVVAASRALGSGATSGAVTSWVKGGVGLVDTRYSFRAELDCNAPSVGCNRHVSIIQKIAGRIVRCEVTDFDAVDDWALVTALAVCRTLVPADEKRAAGDATTKKQ